MVILSLFPGIGMLDQAFEEEFPEACLVRGPDVLWGGDVRRFHAPLGVFWGVIGGPPCQCFSRLAHLQRAQGREPRFGNLIPEFERVVAEAAPDWWIMENVPGAPLPEVPGYQVHSQLLNNRWLGEEQNRVRRISFGTGDGRKLHIEPALLMAPERYIAVTSNVPGPNSRDAYVKATQLAVTSLDGYLLYNGKGKLKRTYVGAVSGAHAYRKQTVGAGTGSDGGTSVRMSRYTVPEACRLQGLPEGFLEDAPFTVDGKRRVIANGVPIPMGRAIARAVRRATGMDAIVKGGESDVAHSEAPIGN